MTEAAIPFVFGDKLVRVINDINGNPWFVAKDVCRVLEIEWKGSGIIGRRYKDERPVRRQGKAVIILFCSEVAHD